MKTWLTVGVLALAIALLADSKPNQATRNDKQTARQGNTRGTGNPQTCPCTQNNQYESTGHPDEAHNGKPYWYTPFKRPEWVAIIAAFVTLGVLIWQTIIGGRSADAALLNAQAVINSERAWIVAELVPICVKFGNWWHRPVGDAWAILSDEEILRGHHLNHRLKLTNMGRTPATILTFELEHSTLTEGIGGPRGETIKDIENNEFDRVVVGGQSVQDTPINISEFENKSIKKVGDSNAFVGFYGRITYQHIFDRVDVQEVRFRYLSNPFTQQLMRMPQPKKKDPN